MLENEVGTDLWDKEEDCSDDEVEMRARFQSTFIKAQHALLGTKFVGLRTERRSPTIQCSAYQHVQQPGLGKAFDFDSGLP